MVEFKDHSIPLYYQVENILREKINSGEYKPGDLFPTEDELMRYYGVSRVTVRQALSGLQKDRLISRKRGKGSFVRELQKHLEPMKLTGMIEDIIDMGIKTKTKIIDFAYVDANHRVAKNLKLDEGSKVLRIERVRLIKTRPISYNIVYVPGDLGEKINPKDLIIHPLLNILEKECEVKLARGMQVIEATLADTRIAPLLGVMTGAPLLRIERTVFDVNERPVEYIIILYRSDRYCYSVELVRKESESKKHWDYAKP